MNMFLSCAGWFLWLAARVPTVVSAVVNGIFYFGLMSAANIYISVMVAIALAAGDCAKPFCFHRTSSWRAKFLFGPIFVIGSLFAAFGFFVNERADGLAKTQGALTRVAQIDKDLENLDQALSRVDQQIKALGAARPVSVIDADIVAKKPSVGHAIWVRTKKCTDVTVKSSQAACRPIMNLYAERKKAEAIKAATAVKSKLMKGQRGDRQRLETERKSLAPAAEDVDGQVEFFRSLGVPEIIAAGFLSVLLMVLLELAAVVCPLLVTVPTSKQKANFGETEPQEEPDNTPRWRKVADLVDKGYTQQAVAQMLQISQPTVSRDLQVARAQNTKRTQAVAKASKMA